MDIARAVWISHQYEITVTIVSFVVCHVLQRISDWILHKAKWYRSLPYLSTETVKGRLHYQTVALSLLHCLSAVPLCAYAFYFEDNNLSKDRLYGKSFWATTQFAISCGYFLWDISWCALEYREFGFAFTLHGFLGASEQMVALIPFANYWDAYLLLFEISTFFMDIHYFLEKMLPEKHPLVLGNGILFVIAFVVVRNIGGTYYTYDMWKALIAMPSNEMLFPRIYVILGSFALWVMNTYWITVILRKVFATVASTDSKKKPVTKKKSPSASPKSQKKKTALPEKMD